MISRILVCCLLALAATGCSDQVVHNTPSGRPEVSILTQDVQGVRSAVLNDMINRGYRQVSDTPSSLVFEAPVQGGAAAVLLGSRKDPTPDARVSYTFVQSDSAVRIVADAAIVTNAGSAFERLTDVSAGPSGAAIQDTLNAMKASIEG